jgi:hypothetical protein
MKKALSQGTDTKAGHHAVAAGEDEKPATDGSDCGL